MKPPTQWPAPVVILALVIVAEAWVLMLVVMELVRIELADRRAKKARREAGTV